VQVMLRRSALSFMRMKPSRLNEYVRICGGCGSWHSVGPHQNCFGCGGILPEATRKEQRDFSELVALGDNKDVLLSRFDFSLVKYPWPIAPMHLAAVLSNISHLKQLSMKHLDTMRVIQETTEKEPLKLFGKSRKNIFIGFSRVSPLRMVCMHYIIDPPPSEFVSDENFIPLKRVISDLEKNDRVLNLVVA
jgi:hypothetical protein